MTALTSPKITATTKMMPIFCNVVLPPTKLMPCTKSVTTHNAKPVNAARTKKDLIRLILPFGVNLDQAAMSRPGRSQQIGVHDPAVTSTGVRAHRADALADIPHRPADQQLTLGAQVCPPPDPGIWWAPEESTVAIEHHHSRPREFGVQLAAGRDQHRLSDLVERQAMPSRERLDRGDPGDHVVVDVDMAGHGRQDPKRAVVQRRVAPPQERADGAGPPVGGD